MTPPDYSREYADLSYNEQEMSYNEQEMSYNEQEMSYEEQEMSYEEHYKEQETDEMSYEEQETEAYDRNALLVAKHKNIPSYALWEAIYIPTSRKLCLRWWQDVLEPS
jgi:hypothetical protein